MTDDLIGRAEAQTAIQFAARRYTVAHEAHGEGQVVWGDNLINVTDAMNVLRDLPSAQPEPEAVFEWKREFKEYIESLDITRDDWKGIIEYIDELPSIQPDVIRCKDCKHWNPQLKTANGNGLGSCDFHNVALVTSEGFCYWAERGEQDDSEAD